MTMTIYGCVPHSNTGVELTEDAAALANISFNPSQDEKILAIKTLAAAFHIICNEIAKENDASAREAAIARTNMQTAAMFAVQARARTFGDDK